MKLEILRERIMKKIYKGCGVAAFFLVVIFLLMLIRINKHTDTDVIYNSYDKQNYQYNDIAVATDQMSGQVVLMSGESGLDVSLPRDPSNLVSINSSAIYGNSDKIYYLCQEIKRNSFQLFSAQKSPDFYIVEFDLDSFEEKIVFSTADILDSSAIKQAIMYPLTSYFFLSPDSLYIATEKLWEIDKRTGELNLLPIECNYGNISYDGEYIYYIEDDSKLYRYSIKKKKSDPVDGIIAKDFFLTENYVCYLNRLDEDKIYLYSLETREDTKIINASATSIFLRKGKIVFVSKEDGLNYCAEINGTNIVRYEDAI